MNTTIKKPTTKSLHLIYVGIILTIISISAACIITLVLSYNNLVSSSKKAYHATLSSQKAEYEASKARYEEVHARLLDEEKEWKATLADKQEAYNSVAKELKAIYDERQAEIDKENARWSALTKEEQKAERLCSYYNDMVTYLRANSKDYAKLYVKYSSYINKDIFNLSKSELNEYTKLYTTKLKLEQDYMKKHPFK